MIKIDRIDREQALRYMAYREGVISPAAEELLDECEKRLLEVIKPKFVYRIFEITSSYPLMIGNVLLPGNDIADHLKGCDRAAMLTVTVGAEADKLIRAMQIEDMAKAVMTDAFASTAAEQCADMAEKAIADETGANLTWRFSPGYGDLPLSMQKVFLEFTDARRRIGVSCLDSDLLAPVKSVTAVVGISDDPIERKRQGCLSCALEQTCMLRKRGSHCGYK
ncbi:MAG: methionine synthase [Oscillospiraceae bacterium]|nr:methionine synthase [Oscillospiraceae bacterium]